MSHSPGHQPRPHSPGHQPPAEQRRQQTPGVLSQSDPEPERPSRPPIWLIVIVLLIAGVIVMHMAGVH